MNVSAFEELQKEFSTESLIVPEIITLPQSGLSPSEVYELCAQQSNASFLFESSKGSTRISRYSFTGWDPRLVVCGKGEMLKIIKEDDAKTIRGNPLDALSLMLKKHNTECPPHIPPFWGGSLCLFSYDLVRQFERIPEQTVDDLDFPDFYLLFFDTIIAFDHEKEEIWLIHSRQVDEKSWNESSKGSENLSFLARDIESLACARQSALSPSHFHSNSQCADFTEFQSNTTMRRFEEMVKKVKSYIRDGDIFQANISQRFETPFEGDPFHLYKRLQTINPSPFSGFLRIGNTSIVSSSPERLVYCRGNKVETRPIAGTRPRGKDWHEDILMTRDLILDEKERAEHIMLVDLERNDLGRICEYGTVKVDEFMTTEEYSHVIHIVSNVSGNLREGTSAVDVLKACFPGGTITGCPKIRCMEIIEEVEPARRGPYTGSLGYMSYSGDMDLNILIRTFLLQNGKAFFQVGAGIVADSVPEREYYETLSKGEALVQAIRRK